MVVEEYLSNFKFTGMTIDQALRSAHNASVTPTTTPMVHQGNSCVVCAGCF